MHSNGLGNPDRGAALVTLLAAVLFFAGKSCVLFEYARRNMGAAAAAAGDLYTATVSPAGKLRVG